ncbi:MAG: ATP-binding cassette domain-containing protein [Acholeplasmataceae bacterium]|jgi:putative ABC transport system permease protein
MLKLEKLTKSYSVGKFVTKAIDNMSLEFRKSEFVTILGPSGCGKTTLLNMLGALDTPDSGIVRFNGVSLKKFGDKKLDKYRNKTIGFIFQTHNLIQHLSIIDNVKMGMTLSGLKGKQSHEKALELLDKVGLIEHLHKKPNQLSVGQSQRVAIARALANDPEIILADEPTGSVDSKTAVEIMKLIKEFGKDKLVIMVTHNPQLAEEYSTRIIKLNDGKILSDSDPFTSSEVPSNGFKMKKKFMSFRTSLTLSFKNLRTKPGRSILMALASSVGLIGIALIFALAGGIKQEIFELQARILGRYPINVSFDSYQQEKLVYIEEYFQENFVDREALLPIEKKWSVTDDPSQYNQITQDFVDYINQYSNENDKNVLGVTVKPKLTYTILFESNTDNGDKTYKFFSGDYGKATKISEQTGAKATLLPRGKVFDYSYEYVAGDRPSTVTEIENKTFGVVFFVNEYNRIPTHILGLLGYPESEYENVQVKEFLGKEFYLWPGAFSANVFSAEESIKLKISGIVKKREGGEFSISNYGIGFTDELVEYLTDNYPKAVSVNDYDYVHIFPANFKAKDKIAHHIDKYNETLSADARAIIYFDRSQIYMDHLENIINVILLGLIIFSSISLGVSSVMIATITFTSVVERTKEIGILRALGARKVDIFRIFSGENTIIGFSAGVFSIAISHLLTIPINFIARTFYDIPHLAQINMWHSIPLMAISLFVTFAAGFLPSRIATNKNPVESLRVQ